MGAGPVEAAEIAEFSLGLPSAAAGERSMSAAVPGGNARGFLQVERDLPRGGDGWRTDGEPEARKDRLDHLGLGDGGNDRRSSSALFTPQNIFSEHPHHQLRPSQSSLAQADGIAWATSKIASQLC